MIRPIAPSLRFAPSIWELTLGFWHLTAGVLVAASLAAGLERRSLKKRRWEQ